MEDYNHIAYFSSRGPTEDGRIKPDLLAPGRSILSAASRPSRLTKGDLCCDPLKRPFVGTLTSLLGINFFRPVIFMAGTSMASPGAAGAGAMVRQYFESGFYPSGKGDESASITISGTLVKAILINGGQTVAGVDNGVDGFYTPSFAHDNHQGFGRINLMNSLNLDGKSSFETWVKDLASVAPDESISEEFTIKTSSSCSSKVFSITLVWADPPGVPGCMKCLLNDLDLVVVKNGDETLYPNSLSAADTNNNVERVQDFSVSDGDSFNVTVAGTNLISDSQTYSMVATGCFETTASKEVHGGESEARKLAVSTEEEDNRDCFSAWKDLSNAIETNGVQEGNTFSICDQAILFPNNNKMIHLRAANTTVRCGEDNFDELNDDFDVSPSCTIKGVSSGVFNIEAINISIVGIKFQGHTGGILSNKSEMGKDVEIVHQDREINDKINVSAVFHKCLFMVSKEKYHYSVWFGICINSTRCCSLLF